MYLFNDYNIPEVSGGMLERLSTLLYSTVCTITVLYPEDTVLYTVSPPVRCSVH